MRSELTATHHRSRRSTRPSLVIFALGFFRIDQSGMDHLHQPTGGQSRPASLALTPEYGTGGNPYARRGSEAMISEGPMTPPMSPGHSEEGGMEDSITIDSQPRFSGPTQPPMPSDFLDLKEGADWSDDQGMDETMEGVRTLSPPRQPLRLLEDEHVHVEKSGSLKLKDFEIKGTLGMRRPNSLRPMTTVLIVFLF